MKLLKRAAAPTPRFFRILRTIGLAAAAAATALLAAPIALPATVITLAGYLAVSGGIIGAVSQLTTTGDVPKKEAEYGAP